MPVYLNKVLIVGRATKDPEIKTTPSGQKVTSLGVATNRNFKDKEGNKQEQVEFHNVVFWGRLAEIVGQYLVKGQEVLVEGRLQTRSWDGQDGVKRYRTEIVAESMQLGAKSGGQGGNFVAGENGPKKLATNEEENLATNEDVEEIKIEDIPF